MFEKAVFREPLVRILSSSKIVDDSATMEEYFDFDQYEATERANSIDTELVHEILFDSGLVRE
jgi:hypothetical protein